MAYHGKPRVVLHESQVIEDKALGVIKYLLWKNHGVSTPDQHELVNGLLPLAT